MYITSQLQGNRMNNVSDILQRVNDDDLYLIIDIEKKSTGYLFSVYNLTSHETEGWFEPWEQALNANYWHTLA